MSKIKKVYIGQAKDHEQRWYQHKWEANRDIPLLVINKAMKKHGIDNFIFEVIATCKTLDDANELETFLVQQYESHISLGKGYNVSWGGFNAPKTEASNIKRSKTMKEKCANGWMPANINELSALGVAARKGKPSPNKGRKASEETRQKISAGGKGRVPWNKGKTGVLTEETLQKMSLASKGKHYSVATEFKKGMTPHNKGKKTGKPSWNTGKFITLTQPQMQEVKRLLENGLSLRKIAPLIGIARHIISRELKKNNVI